MMELETVKLIIEVAQIIGNSYFFLFLIGAILLDIITGLNKARKSGETNSKVGNMGITNHIKIIAVAVFICALSIALGQRWFGQALIVFYITNYLVSIVENLNASGINFPSFIVRAIRDVHNKSDEGDKSIFKK